MALMHYSTAEDNPFRRDDEQRRTDPIGEITRFEIPDRIVGRDLRNRPTSSRRQGRTTGNPFQATAMEGTDAREAIAIKRWYGHVTDFRMHQTMEWLAVDRDPAPDTGPDRQIKRRV